MVEDEKVAVRGRGEGGEGELIVNDSCASLYLSFFLEDGCLKKLILFNISTRLLRHGRTLGESSQQS